MLLLSFVTQKPDPEDGQVVNGAVEGQLLVTCQRPAGPKTLKKELEMASSGSFSFFTPVRLQEAGLSDRSLEGVWRT